MSSATNEPEPIVTNCPQCGALHVDEGEWATRPHRTHQCMECSAQWRPKETNTVGVKPDDPRLR
jgi:hypothetical protein